MRGISGLGLPGRRSCLKDYLGAFRFLGVKVQAMSGNDPIAIFMEFFL
jgi:hypothetical protein